MHLFPHNFSSEQYPPYSLEKVKRQSLCLQYPEEVYERPKVKGVTIDVSNTKTFDDAFWLEWDRTRFYLQVSISDPTSTIPLDSPLEQMAFHKATTNPRKAIFPKKMVRKHFSLTTHQPRPALTIFIELSRNNARIQNYVVQETLITSQRNICPTDINKIAINNRDPLKDMMVQARKLGKRIMQVRKGRVFNDERSPEKGYQLQPNALTKGILSGDKVLMQVMILANELMARFLQQKHLMALFRNQVLSDVFQEIPEQTVVDESSEVFGLRKKAKGNVSYYHPINRGHVALQSPGYIQFTSPLRKYPDFLNHRIIRSALYDHEPPYSFPRLLEISTQVNTAIWKILTCKNGEGQRLMSSSDIGLESSDGIDISPSYHYLSEDQLQRLSNDRLVEILYQYSVDEVFPVSCQKFLHTKLKNSSLSTAALFQIINNPAATSRILQKALVTISKSPKRAYKLYRLSQDIENTWESIKLTVCMRTLGSYRARLRQSHEKTIFVSASSKKEAQHRACLIYWKGKIRHIIRNRKSQES